MIDIIMFYCFNRQSNVASISGNSRSSRDCLDRRMRDPAMWATEENRRCPTRDQRAAGPPSPTWSSQTNWHRRRLSISSQSRRRRWCPTWTGWTRAAPPPLPRLPGQGLQGHLLTLLLLHLQPPPQCPPGTATTITATSTRAILIKKQPPSPQ